MKSISSRSPHLFGDLKHHSLLSSWYQSRNRLLCSHSISYSATNSAPHIRAFCDATSGTRASSSSSNPGRMIPHHVPPPLPIPEHIPRPSFAFSEDNRPSTIFPSEHTQVKDAVTIEKMRVAARIARDALRIAIDNCRVGTTTDEVDRKCQEYVMSQNAYPTGVKFHGFPRAICTSVNEVVVHGVPDLRPLENGDIINCDVSIFYDGVFGDTSSMALVGDVDESGRQLCLATKHALFKAIGAVRPGASLCDVARNIEIVAAASNFGIVREFTGHFIGRELHMLPNVHHTLNDKDVTLQPGMTFTIEPVLTEGSPEIAGPWEDGWTYVTKDGKRAAQYEHTVLVTESGCDILTL